MMFKVGFKKTAVVALKSPQTHVDPVTARDALGASSKGFKPIGSGFGSGHHPKGGIKGLSEVRRVS